MERKCIIICRFDPDAGKSNVCSPGRSHMCIYVNEKDDCYKAIMVFFPVLDERSHKGCCKVKKKSKHSTNIWK